MSPLPDAKSRIKNKPSSVRKNSSAKAYDFFSTDLGKAVLKRSAWQGITPESLGLGEPLTDNQGTLALTDTDTAPEKELPSIEQADIAAVGSDAYNQGLQKVMALARQYREMKLTVADDINSLDENIYQEAIIDAETPDDISGVKITKIPEKKRRRRVYHNNSVDTKSITSSEEKLSSKEDGDVNAHASREEYLRERGKMSDYLAEEYKLHMKERELNERERKIAAEEARRARLQESRDLLPNEESREDSAERVFGSAFFGKAPSHPSSGKINSDEAPYPQVRKKQREVVPVRFKRSGVKNVEVVKLSGSESQARREEQQRGILTLEGVKPKKKRTPKEIFDEFMSVIAETGGVDSKVERLIELQDLAHANVDGQTEDLEAAMRRYLDGLNSSEKEVAAKKGLRNVDK